MEFELGFLESFLPLSFSSSESDVELFSRSDELSSSLDVAIDCGRLGLNFLRFLFLLLLLDEPFPLLRFKLGFDLFRVPVSKESCEI